LTSIALQYRRAAESLVKKFAYQRFEPAGSRTNPRFPECHSITDIFPHLGCQFLKGSGSGRRLTPRAIKFPLKESRRLKEGDQSPPSRNCPDAEKN